jgi:hypothetical protein
VVEVNMDKSTKPSDVKATKILARSFYRELRENGYSCNQILGLATELIDLVTRELRADTETAAVPEQKSPSADWRQAL